MLVCPAAWFLHAVTDESNEEGGDASEHKHGTPAISVANKIVGERRQNKAEIVSGMHESRAHFPEFLRPLLRDEWARHGPLAADTIALQLTEDRQHPYAHA